MTIFVTGGAGYIGSHTCVELLNAGHDIVVYDNFSNSSVQSLQRIETITRKPLRWIKGDIRDETAITKAMHGCDAVIHFAGLKSVGESVSNPLDYYDNNVQGTLSLLRAMQTHGLKTLVFSSSATVYGDPEYLPIDESHPLRTSNPYGHTKLIIEDILRSLYNADKSWKIMILRYFNPVGAHESGLIGENPRNIPNNLMPFIAQVAIGARAHLNVFGNDYNTPDGTGIRDYIHVVDLAQGHLKALEVLTSEQCTAINLGTGIGYSVLEMVSAFEKACTKPVPYVIVPRRPGDVAISYADASLARKLLGWKAERTLDSMCHDTWSFQSTIFQGSK